MRALSRLRYGLRRRRALLQHWLAGRTNGQSLTRVLRECLAPPSSWKARRKIRAIRTEGDLWVVRLRGLPDPLYFPVEAGRVALDQTVAELMYPRSWHFYESPQTPIAAEDVVADCGAGEGLFSLLAARRCRRVYAFEPAAMFVAALRRTFSASHNVEIVPRALGRREGRAALAGGGLAWRLGPDGSGRPVEVTTLDALFARADRSLSFLKADLEGWELEMLAGGRETIRRFAPKIAITTYHRPEHAEAIAAFLTEIDPRYRIRVTGIHHPTGAPVLLHAWVS